ncbi:beta-lactamase/transpeptidase-like protein [Achaetomium macrosporum]|uniref:Beta-lactamase/transpeptidase-like protein n=1 Tax=Achaetomium macrosporum TaxID=79813 RepID=A0AAN7HF82_9PEZI|nr:beta-lactamase/transpeptidase-like protein [Achaetomium macrosporum]
MGSLLSRPPGYRTQKAHKVFCRLHRSWNTIEKILSITGTPSLSLRVICSGKAIYTAHHGFRDVEHQLAPDNDTLHNINSMSKALISVLAAVIADTGGISLDEPIATCLPDFSFRDKGLAHQITILDLLFSSDAWRMFASLEQVAPMLVGHILEKVAGQNLDELLQLHIFKPLGMTRTGTAWDPADHNQASSYMVLSDISPFEIPHPQLGPGSVMEAAGGIKSTLADLSRFYVAFLSAVMDEFGQARDGRTTHPIPPPIFRNCRELVTHRSTIPPATLREQGYGMGWARAQLPGPIGRVGFNPGIAEPPDIAKGAPSTLVLYHNGSMPGSTRCVCLVPDEEVVIIALQNSTAAIDTADTVCQLVLELLLNPTHPIDFVSHTRKLSGEALCLQSRVGAALLSRRRPGRKPSRALEAYAGVYWNYMRTFSIEILADGRKLRMRLQRRASEEFWLSHYEDDTFSWWMPHDEIMRRGRYVGYGPKHYLISFSVPVTGEVDSLRWAWDTTREEVPEVFTKENGPHKTCSDSFSAPAER